MKKRKRYDPDMPFGKLVEVENFLPPPDQLIFPKDTEKITIALTRSTITYFKSLAKTHRTKYQKMIREVLDRYASRYHRAK